MLRVCYPGAAEEVCFLHSESLPMTQTREDKLVLPHFTKDLLQFTEEHTHKSITQTDEEVRAKIH